MSVSSRQEHQPFQRESLLTQALDAAYCIDEDGLRHEWVERVADAAIRHDHPQLAREILLDHPDPQGVAWLRYRLGVRQGPPGAVRDLCAASAYLEGATDGGSHADGAWSPRPDWPAHDHARAAVACALAAAGDLGAADALARSIPGSRTARARAAVGLALAQPLESGARSPSLGWALATLRVLDDANDRRRMLSELIMGVARAGAGGVARELLEDALKDDPGAWFSDGLQRLLLLEAVAPSLEGASGPWAWDAAVGLARALEPLAAATALCRIARSQAEAFGPAGAARTVDAALDLVRDAPLPPDPDAPYPWRELYQLALAETSLAPPILRELRLAPSMTPSWCYAFGTLELACGNRDMAERAADALEQAYSPADNDLAPLVLAGILRARAGSVEPALQTLRRLQGETDETDTDETDTAEPVGLPGADRARVTAEEQVANALLDAGHPAPAMAVARLSPAPSLRARVFTRAAAALHLEGQPERATSACEEALQALEGARRDGLVSPDLVHSLPGQLAAILALSDQPYRALDALQWGIQATVDLEGTLAISLLASLLSRVRPTRQAELIDLVAEACAHRVLDADDPAERCNRLLVLVDSAAAS